MDSDEYPCDAALPDPSAIEDVRRSQMFIRAWQASLDNSGIDPDAIERPRTPIPDSADIHDDPDSPLSLDNRRSTSSPTPGEANLIESGSIDNMPPFTALQNELAHHRRAYIQLHAQNHILKCVIANDFPLPHIHRLTGKKINTEKPSKPS